MDVNYGHENVSHFAFTSPPPSIPEPPGSTRSLHAHSLSSEGGNPLFHPDISSQLNFAQEANSVPTYSRPPSGLQSPVMLSTFPPAANIPFIESLGRHRGSSFTSPPITSPSRSGFETPITPAESLHSRSATNLGSLPTDSSPGISFSTSDLVTLSVLEGIEASVKAAREAMARGDRLTFQSRAQNVVSSAELLRGFGTNHHYPSVDHTESSFVAETLNFDAINLVPQSGALLSADTGMHSPESQYASSLTTDPSLRIPQTSHSFAHGLALLEVGDPSRKRTISTATARAVENDRAPKTQKTSPSRRESLSYQSTGSNPASAGSGDFFQPQPPSSQSSWLDFSQEPSFLETEMASMDGLVTNQPPNLQSTRASHVNYTPSPLARNGFRESRSSSYSSAHPSLSSFGLEHQLKAESSQSSAVPSRPHSPESFFTESDADIDWDPSPSRRNSQSVHMERSDASPSRPSHRSMPSADVLNISNLVPPSLKSEMDKVFDVYLQGVCSDLEATDSKGEPIHQTLMPKKMAKMAESNDFRPFKFRIQAFTNAFMDVLAQRGLGEDVVAQKKVKAYLWHQQPLISRFNDDGKKSKSKGNHVWHIMAKQSRLSEKSEVMTWIFRAFERRIMGSPPPLAYVGLNWTWQPRIWDPQMPSQSIRVVWSSPQLPSWLSWRRGILVGIPGSGDVTAGIDIVVDASFPAEQRDSTTTSFNLQVSPHTVSQQMHSAKPHRLSVDGSRGRPITPVSLQGLTSSDNAPTTARPKNSSLDQGQVLQVITQSIHAVAAAQSQEASSRLNDAEDTRGLSLARQQRVLVTTAEALSSLSMELSTHLALPSVSLIAAVATEIVSDLAAHYLSENQHTSDQQGMHIVASNAPTLPDTSIPEIADLFRLIVSQAVGQDETTTTELEVIMIAKHIVKQRADALFMSTPNAGTHSLAREVGDPTAMTNEDMH